jgi:hypothetical protein
MCLYRLNGNSRRGQTVTCDYLRWRSFISTVKESGAILIARIPGGMSKELLLTLICCLPKGLPRRSR